MRIRRESLIFGSESNRFGCPPPLVHVRYRTLKNFPDTRDSVSEKQTIQQQLIFGNHRRSLTSLVLHNILVLPKGIWRQLEIIFTCEYFLEWILFRYVTGKKPKCTEREFLAILITFVKGLFIFLEPATGPRCQGVVVCDGTLKSNSSAV